MKNERIVEARRNSIAQAWLVWKRRRDAAPLASQEIDRRIGLNIASRRRQAGWRQGDFAQIVGLDLRRLRAYERGEERISPETLMRAAQIFGVRPSDIFRVAIDDVCIGVRIRGGKAGAKADYPDCKAQLNRLMDVCEDLLRILDLVQLDEVSP